MQISERVDCTPPDCSPPSPDYSPLSQQVEDNSNATETMKKLNEMVRSLEPFIDDKELASGIKNLTKFVKTNLNKPFGQAKIINAFKNLTATGTRKKIRVQKASIARRVSGVTTTNSIGAGRYPNNSFLRIRNVVQKARRHNLRENVEKNQQNSGKF